MTTPIKAHWSPVAWRALPAIPVLALLPLATRDTVEILSAIPFLSVGPTSKGLIYFGCLAALVTAWVLPFAFLATPFISPRQSGMIGVLFGCEGIVFLHFLVLPTGKFDTMHFLRRARAARSCLNCDFTMAGIDLKASEPLDSGIIAKFGAGCVQLDGQRVSLRRYVFGDSGVFLEAHDGPLFRRITIGHLDSISKGCQTPVSAAEVVTAKDVGIESTDSDVRNAYGRPSDMTSDGRGISKLSYWNNDAEMEVVVSAGRVQALTISVAKNSRGKAL